MLTPMSLYDANRDPSECNQPTLESVISNNTDGANMENSEKIEKKRKLPDYAKLSLFGFSMGAANVIPGVSGGTMAFILGIYEELIDSIRAFATLETVKLAVTFKFKRLYDTLPWRFLLALGIGVLVAFVSLAKFLAFSLENYPSLTFALFFGLVLASILAVLKQVKKWSAPCVVSVVLGAIFAFAVVTLVPVETPHVWWNLFLCGMIIICAMILPGISGSFLLLILGQYKYVLAAVNLLVALPVALAKGKGVPSPDVIIEAVMTLIWIALGCIVGLGSFSHFLNWLFKKHHDITVSALIGFMIGSLWKLWPWQERVEVMVKNAGEVVRLQLPLDAAKLEQMAAAGAKVKTLVAKNILPPSYDGAFCLAIGLAVAGFVVVFLMERGSLGSEIRGQ